MRRFWSAAAAVMMLCSCGLFIPQDDAPSAAVIVPSPQNPQEYDLHLLFLPSPAHREDTGAAVTYLPYGSFFHLLAQQAEPAQMSSRELAGMVRTLLGMTPDMIYVSSPGERDAAVRLLGRLEGTGDELVFSYGRDAYVFWRVLLEHSAALSDPQVIVHLGSLYDETQLSEQELGEAFVLLAQTRGRIRSVPASFDREGRLPYDGTLMRMGISQITAGMEGEN